MKKLSVITTLSIASLMIVGGAYIITRDNIKDIVGYHADDTYTLTLDDGLDVSNDYIEITNSRGATFSLGLTYYVKGSGKLGTLSSGGMIVNYSAIHDIEEISITLESGSVDVYNGWRQYSNSDIEYATSPLQSISSTNAIAVDFSSVQSSYFKVAATSNTVIKSISLRYGCEVITTNNNVRINVVNPTVGSSSSISSDNYLWICSNILDTSTWTNYLMTRSGNSFYYDFSNVDVLSSGYTYTLVLSSNDSSPNWEYPSDTQNVGFGIGEGQSEFNLTSINFSSEPAHFNETYTLNLTIIQNGTATSFGNIQFVDNYDGGDSYNWNQYISYSQSSSYTYSKADLDSYSTLYFKIYMWSDNKSIYVGDTNGANFSITPDGSEEINATITFTYVNSSSIVGTLDVESSSSSDMYFANQTISVYGSTIEITPTFKGVSETFTASYSGENIRIDDNKYIVGLKADTVTQVTLTSQSGLTCKFNVNIPASSYNPTYTRDYLTVENKMISSTEKWFDSSVLNTVNEISGMGQDFYNGVDISNTYALYKYGTKFYNSDGVEQSLFYILKNNGINWVRLRLFVDPEDSAGNSFGAGETDIDAVLWMAKETKAAGMNFLLDFHYSDFWTHPGQQVLPKSWGNPSSANALATLIRNYTKDTLNTFKDNNCLPDMVQLGNEISSGSFLSVAGSGTYFDQYGKPNYLSNATDYSYAGNYWTTSGKNNMKTYLTAASNGVNDVDSSIKKVIHWAKVESTVQASDINSFFNSFSSIDYDYAGISLYPFYCFDTISECNSILSGLSLSKPWFVAETSYPFSGKSYVYENEQDVTNNAFSDWTTSGITNIKSSYPLTAQGQANLIRDLTNSVVTYGGEGIFYWEAAWVPNIDVGWSISGSGCTWSNQGFFSYDGKETANMKIFAKMSPYI